ncbi:putative quinol monooxygenase [Cupriavidus sp. CuC1]|uniref:putative quinol monooxygenase n=1 Tax=Cupriavidus sp. CuC1 TaxID=3373131 RepID=UPI0037CF23E5
MMQEKNVIASFYPIQGLEDQVESVLRGMIVPTRSEPGNTRYDLYKVAEPVSFHLFESYANDNALATHRQTTHYKAYREAITSLLRDPIGVLVMAPVDVKS